MPETFYITSITQAHQSLGILPPKHPMISVVHASEIKQTSDFIGKKVVMNLYQVMYKELGCGSLLW